MAGGPDDAVEDEAAEVIDFPVAVEVRHDDGEAAAAVGALDAPGDDFAFGVLGGKHGSGEGGDVGGHAVAVGAKVVVVVRLFVLGECFPASGDGVAGGGGCDSDGIEDASDGFVVGCAAGGEVAAHPAQQRVIAVWWEIFGLQAGGEVEAGHAAAALHHTVEVGQDAGGVGHADGREDVADEDDGGDAVEGGGVLWPPVEGGGAEAGEVLHVLKTMGEETAAGTDLVSAGWVAGGADDDEDFGGLFGGGGGGERGEGARDQEGSTLHGSHDIRKGRRGSRVDGCMLLQQWGVLRCSDAFDVEVFDGVGLCVWRRVWTEWRAADLERRSLEGLGTSDCGSGCAAGAL